MTAARGFEDGGVLFGTEHGVLGLVSWHAESVKGSLGLDFTGVSKE
jgi:hypothetical protein